MSNLLEIIVVDDNVLITDIISDYIDFSGLKGNVISFNDSTAALEHIKDNSKIDVLITDYKMPIINGIQLLEASSTDTRRIMISGFVSDIAEDRLKELGAIFLAKPVSMKILGGLLKEEYEKKFAPIQQN